MAQLRRNDGVSRYDRCYVHDDLFIHTTVQFPFYFIYLFFCLVSLFGVVDAARGGVIRPCSSFSSSLQNNKEKGDFFLNRSTAAAQMTDDLDSCLVFFFFLFFFFILRMSEENKKKERKK